MAAVSPELPNDLAARSGIRDDEEFNRRNQRRIDLLEKRNAAGWSIEEETEFHCLQRETSEYLNRKYPMPMEELRELERKLRAGFAEAGIPLPPAMHEPTPE
jgi:hypothetical protein